MKKAISLLVCACFFLSLCSCETQKESTTEFTAMNTLMSIRVFGSDKSRNEEALALLTAKIKELDELFDSENSGSDVFRINSGAESTAVDENTAKIIEKSLYASELTDGAFDITVMPVLKLWGFDNGNYRVPKSEELKAALEYAGAEKITVTGKKVYKEPNTQISLGGIAKGYLGDELLKIARETGVGAVISLGGNIVLCGENTQKGSWTVGVKNPADTSSVLCTFKHGGDVSIVTSGAYERSFQKNGETYHHIIDPKTGEPAESDLLSVTVIGADGTLCDAFSTALFVMGKEKAVKFANEHNDFEYIFVTQDKEIIATDGVLELSILSEEFKSARK